ncbi:hypothetical protein CQW23_15795 [Capsicum baccatum]|uniref:DYW domain-containing protein n=1 Tax=Capsicum baccatum TaxID=33114 RepID=A0A2G2WN19_CAPBA|nr:hypothetical protein CQW23_15795 [Capsicum baccatum]
MLNGLHRYVPAIREQLQKASAKGAAVVSEYIGYLEKGQIPPKVLFQGGLIVSWKNERREEMLFRSNKHNVNIPRMSNFPVYTYVAISASVTLWIAFATLWKPPKAIRGGIPISFPQDALKHLFASRIADIKNSPHWNRLSFISFARNGLVLMDDSLQLIPAVETLDLSRNKFTKPRPIMKSSKRKEEENLSEEITEIEDPVSGISAQIEKLVFHKRMMLFARSIFDDMPERNSVSWNTMVGGLLDLGDYLEAFRLFFLMWEDLSAADSKIFETMIRASSGLEGMPQKNVISWNALIGGYGNHGRGIKAVKLFERMVREGMMPNHVTYLAVLSACKQDEAAAVVQTLKRKGLGIKSACTWIEIKKLPHVFLSGDKCHVQTKEIYEKVDELMLEISKYGYVTEGETLLPDVDEQEQKLPHYHGEKLAISFGLISTSSSTPLQLVQSHRVCNDCHNAIKLIAMITKREIVVRDASRFHRFKNHTCSCGDYW